MRDYFIFVRTSSVHCMHSLQNIIELDWMNKRSNSKSPLLLMSSYFVSQNMHGYMVSSTLYIYI